MSQKLRLYLRTHRLRSGLTQKDVAFLLSLESQSIISRIEKNICHPSVVILLGYSLIFRVPVDQLVPGLLNDIDQSIINRAKILQSELKNGQLMTPAIQERIKFLETMISKEDLSTTQKHAKYIKEGRKTQIGVSS